MLPSTGYFNAINCPFYENGPCDRPYCHFRHARKDLQNTTNNDMESGAILQKLVSAAVQRVLQQTEASATLSSTEPAAVDSVSDISKPAIISTATKATYNPTPIAELNKINNTDAENNEDVNEQRKRHIPVPYTPRKPASIPIKRPVDTNGSSKPFIYNPPPLKYTPGSADNIPNDTYTPPGAVESTEKYLPGTEKELPEFTPDPTTQDASNKRNYVPSSEKTVNKQKILEYKPSNPVKSFKPTLTYQPTPRSLAPCFSSDEEEPENKKIKLSNDLNGLDDLGAEFDILDQILDEEKPTEETKTKVKKDVDTELLPKHSTSENKERNGDASKSEKDRTHKSHHKSDKKEKSSSDSKDKKEDRHKSSDKTKSSSRDKEKEHKRSKSKEKRPRDSKEQKKDKEHKNTKDGEKEERGKKEDKNKHSSDKKKHSSKTSDDNHKHSKHSSSRKSEKHSESKSSRSESKRKENRDKEKDKKYKSKYEEDKKKSKKSISENVSDNDDFANRENGHDDDEYDMSEDDAEAIALECKRIFEEYVPTEQPKNTEDCLKTEDDPEDYIPGKKRVSRTIDKNIKVTPKAPIKPDFKVSAAQAMAERLAKVREFHNSRQPPPTPPVSNIIENHSIKTDISKSLSSSTNSKIRIAHVPYASTMLNAKRTIPPPTKTPSQPSTSSTICQTVKKGVQRVAHVPNEKFIDRPGVLEPLASKIAANIRSIYLNMMIDECLKLYINPTDAYARAQHEELNTSKKCSTVQIYKNSAVLAVSRLRKELQECNGVKKTGSSCPVIGSNISNKSAGSWSIESKNRKGNDNSEEFIGAKFFKNISKWVLTEEQLQSNGYPRPHASGEKGRAIIYGQNKQQPPKGYLRTCCRCKKEYTVTKKGFAAVNEECIYHPNRLYRVRGEAKYQCCSQDGTSDGCCVAPSHVYEYVDFENLKGYVTTLPPESSLDDYGVYSLDCEMCYTTQGLDLTRVTVINSNCKVIYETLVRPLHPIIDYNTRYSGITEEQMANVRTTLLEVQATLLAMFSSKTILVGHSLESDFKALKLIHNTVVDTSVLFPHKMGPPYKRALRNLSSEHLKKIIQNSVDGHDSAEDAMVCMELLHYKLKEELKTR